jgi:peptide/nickel transport system substrate-binding protein
MMSQDDRDLPDVDRRTMMKLAGAAGAAGLAGCSQQLPGGGGGGGFDEVQQMLEEGFSEASFEPPWEGQIISNQNPQRVQWVQVILEELNNTEYFDLELNQFEWTTYVGRILAENSHTDAAIIALGWSAGWDPDAYIRNLFHSDQHTPACCNINHYANEEVDQLIDDGTATTDIQERADIYESAQEAIVSDSPMAFIRFDEEVVAFRTDRLENWDAYPINGGLYTGLFAPWADSYAQPVDGSELAMTLAADVGNSDPTQINDTTSSMANDPLIYEGLMDVDFDGEPQLQLAKSIEQISDTEYVFELREGVQFHPSQQFDFDGREMVAEDVKFSWERYIGTTREADVGDWLGITEDGGFQGSVTVEGDYSLRVELPEVYAPFRFNVGEGLVVPREAGEDGPLDLSTEPIGTGPFRFDQYDPDELWRVERFDDYWYDGSGEVPEQSPIETVTFRVITEQSAQEAALRSGDVDFADNPPAGSVSKLQEEDGFEVKRRVAGGYDFLNYPMHPEADTPFQNRKVRLAVNRMIDRESIIQAVYDGIGTPAFSPISPLAGAFTSEEFNQQMGDEYSRYYERS